MENVFCVLALIFFLILNALINYIKSGAWTGFSRKSSNSPSFFKGNVEYGWNSKAEYGPVRIDGQEIEYGWDGNSQGMKFVPKKIGGKEIEYGWNSKAEYGPIRFDGQEIEYGWDKNPKGMKFAPKRINNNK